MWEERQVAIEWADVALIPISKKGTSAFATIAEVSLLLFVDLKEAYDTVPQEALCCALKILFPRTEYNVSVHIRGVPAWHTSTIFCCSDQSTALKGDNKTST